MALHLLTPVSMFWSCDGPNFLSPLGGNLTLRNVRVPPANFTPQLVSRLFLQLCVHSKFFLSTED